MKTFNDLIFTKHSSGLTGAVQAKLALDNNITLSVIGGPGLYGDGINTFEVGAWHNDSKDWIKLPEFDDQGFIVGKDDVVRWQSKDDINEIIQRLEGMNKKP